MNIEGLKNTFQYGMHGCGYYKGTNHVNTLEALKYWRKQGVKIMEIDMTKTQDGGFVALAHLMNKHYLNLVEIDIPENREDLTEEWFMNQKLCKRTTSGLSPMNLSMIVEIMREDPELFVMFDLWRMWSSEDTYLFSNKLLKLFEGSDLKDRCVIEVYNRDMINGVRRAAKDLHLIYCVHAPNVPEYEENVSPEILLGMGVKTISYPWVYAKENLTEIEEYNRKQFVIFSLSKDNLCAKQMRNAGVNVNLLDIKYNPNNITYLGPPMLIIWVKEKIWKLLIYLKKLVLNERNDNRGIS